MIILTAMLFGVSEPLIFKSEARTFDDFRKELDKNWIKIEMPAFLKVEYIGLQDAKGDYVDSKGEPVMNAQRQLYPNRTQQEITVSPQVGFMIKGNLTYDASAEPLLNTKTIISIDLLEKSMSDLYLAQVPIRYNEYTKQHSSIKLANEQDAQTQVLLSGGMNGGRNT